MGAAAAKELGQLSPRELKEGATVVSRDVSCTGEEAIEAVKQNKLRIAEIESLTARVAELEAELTARDGEKKGDKKVVDAEKALAAIAAEGATAESLTTAGFDAVALRAAGVAAEKLRDAGFTAAQCKDAGYEAPELYELCGEFPLNEEGSPTFDPQYNKFSILHADGLPVLTASSYGAMKVASWSPDMYSAPPAWTRDEDGFDVRNKHKARRLEWASASAAVDDAEEEDEEEEEEEDDS